MSDLIPSCSWENFKKIVDMGKVNKMQSCEVLLPEHDFTVIIFHGDGLTRDYARTQAEYLAQRSNSVSGKTPAEVMAEIEEEICRVTNSDVKTDAVTSKSTENSKKPRKSRKYGVRRAKAKRKGSGRALVGASAGSMTPTPT